MSTKYSTSFCIKIKKSENSICIPVTSRSNPQDYFIEFKTKCLRFALKKYLVLTRKLQKNIVKSQHKPINQKSYLMSKPSLNATCKDL